LDLQAVNATQGYYIACLSQPLRHFYTRTPPNTCLATYAATSKMSAMS